MKQFQVKFGVTCAMGNCCEGNENKQDKALEDESKQGLIDTEHKIKDPNQSSDHSEMPSISNASKQINHSKSRQSQQVITYIFFLFCNVDDNLITFALYTLNIQW